MSTEERSVNVIKPNKISTNLLMHILLIVFLGRFWLWPWVYKTTALLNDVKGIEFRKPSSKLALFILVPFYSVYWFRKTAKGVEFTGKQASVTISFAGICTFFAFFIPSVASILIQMEIENLSTIELPLSKNIKSATTPTINSKNSSPKKEPVVEEIVKRALEVDIKEDTVLNSQEEVEILCPHCKETLYFMKWESGEKVKCPFCDKELVV